MSESMAESSFSSLFAADILKIKLLTDELWPYLNDEQKLVIIEEIRKVSVATEQLYSPDNGIILSHELDRDDKEHDD